MTRWTLKTLALTAAFLLSLIGFGAPWLSVWTLGEIRLRVTATVAMISLVAAFATAVFAIVVHRQRGLWVALSAQPALLFWPVFSVALSMMDYND